jgi:Protein of unknown function (DUF3152)
MTKRILRLAPAVALLALGGCAPAPEVEPGPRPGTVAPTAVRAPARAAPVVPITYPRHGSGHWATTTGQPGGSGLRYRVLVETSIKGLDPDGFARQVTQTLDDPRGWRVPMRRVGPGSAADFTIYLATPGTRDRLCGHGRDGYTSCRNGDSVVLNVARWVKAVPGIAPAGYRQYMVNHEVGHRLGHGHELCPGQGRPAPVMQQQTLGLHGCTPWAWPRIDGRLYAGVSGQYADKSPPPDPGSN